MISRCQCFAGSTFLLFGVPILIIAFLAIAYLIISGEEEFPEFKYIFMAFFVLLSAIMILCAHEFRKIQLSNLRLENCLCRKKVSKIPRFSLWTFPVLVDGPFGVVSAAEMIGILLFSLYIIWAVSVFTMRNYDLLSWFESQGFPSKDKLYDPITIVFVNHLIVSSYEWFLYQLTSMRLLSSHNFLIISSCRFVCKVVTVTE